MNVSGLVSSASLQALLAASASSTPAPTTPAAQARSLLASSQTALFSSLGGASSGMPDLLGLTAAAQAYSLYTNPAMLRELASGAASASAPSTAPVVAPPAYSFNPFDQASWWSNSGSSLGATVDATA